MIFQPSGIEGQTVTSSPGKPSAGQPATGTAPPERVGYQWSNRDLVTNLWATGMRNPVIRSAFWRLAYGTDAGLFTYEWERLGEGPAGTRILDVPSGAGVALVGLCPDTPVAYTAVDIAQAMIDRVGEIAAERRLHQVTAIRADATDMPFDNGSFDLVVTYNGLHCLNQPWKALQEMRRVLANDGRIRGTILVRRPDLVANRVQRYFQWRTLLGEIGTWAEILRWFDGAGLEVVRTRQAGALAFFEGRPAGASVR